MLVEMRVAEPDGEQVLNQHAPEILLLFGRRLARRVPVGLGVDRYVAEKAVKHGIGHVENPASWAPTLTAAAALG
jgi:hypothetical protein